MWSRIHTKLYFNIEWVDQTEREWGSVQKTGVPLSKCFLFPILVPLRFQFICEIGWWICSFIRYPKIDEPENYSVRFFHVPGYTTIYKTQISATFPWLQLSNMIEFYFFFALNFIQLVDFAVVIPSLILLQRNIDWWWLSWLKLIVLFSQSVQII